MRLLLLGVLSTCLSFHGVCEEENNCLERPFASRITLRHIDPKGVGYIQGYTTLELFLAPRAPLRNAWIPFIDLRGHMFNDGRSTAANAGLGCRYETKTRVWGVNAYYDYHQTRYQHYNQIAVGLESLGKVWDARLNGYLPVGNKKSPFFGTPSGSFIGNTLIISKEYEFAMKTINAEAGLHIDSIKNIPFYVAAGPYYLNGRGRAAFGFETRVRADFFNILRLEGNGSYDHIFKWIGQGQIGVTVPLGKKSRRKEPQPSSCPPFPRITKRAVQPVDRFEIIVINDPAKEMPASDPATGQPFVFWFVDNRSASGKGTFDAPFNTLQAAEEASAPGQVIYVLPGDGSTKGMDSGIVLKEDQMLLGASVVHSTQTIQGLFTIPSIATTMPTLANAQGNVIGLANRNVVSGFCITSMNGYHGLENSQPIETLSSSKNHYCSSGGGHCILNSAPIGTLTSSEDVFRTDGSSAAIRNESAITTLICSQDRFENMDFGIENRGPISTLVSSNNTFTHFAGPGYCIGNFDMINTLKSTDDAFRYLKDESSGVYNASMIGTLSCTKGIFSHLSGESRGIHNLGTIGTFDVIQGTLSYLSERASGIYNEGSITTLNSTKNTFNNLQGNATCIRNQSTITTLNSTSTLFNNLHEYSSGIYNIGTMTIAKATNNVFNNLSQDASGVYNMGTITSWNSSTNNISNLSGGAIGMNNKGIITILRSAGNVYSNLQQGSAGLLNEGTVTNFTSSADMFKNVASASAIVNTIRPGASLGSLQIDEGFFDHLDQGSFGIATYALGGAIGSVKIERSNFNTINNGSQGILYRMDSPGNASVKISNNTFSTLAAAGNGYATAIEVSGGSTTLEFTGNWASPESNPAPYQFVQTGLGVLQRTAGSDGSTNTGQINSQ